MLTALRKRLLITFSLVRKMSEISNHITDTYQIRFMFLKFAKN